jgi:hypothetical protein
MNPMKLIGFLIFVAGLTVAGWFASYVPRGEGLVGLARIQVWFGHAGIWFLVGIGAMIVGGVLARRANKAPAGSDAATGQDGGAYRGGSGPKHVLALLDEIASTLEPLTADGLPDGSKKLADTLDALLADTVPDFLDQRELLIDKLGLETFAEMIGHFASMERGAARAWSALTDEVYSEVEPSLQKAKDGIAAAQEIAKSALA